jgi:hypothetical protein
MNKPGLTLWWKMMGSLVGLVLITMIYGTLRLEAT